MFYFKINHNKEKRKQIQIQTASNDPSKSKSMGGRNRVEKFLTRLDPVAKLSSKGNKSF